jgi:hypothetical protein
MVRHANPTGLDLPRAQATRRYALKSRLQSLLVRRFGEALELRDADHTRRTGLLWHRSLATDGCHAVLDDLEPDAQDWFRRELVRLDAEGPRVVAPPQAPAPRDVAPRPVPKGDDVDGLLERSRRALERFELAEARDLLERAQAADPARATTSLALLELLVDRLGDDESARRLARALPAATRSLPLARALAGLAAARAGDVVEAESWLHGVATSRAADGWVALARGAILAGDELRARRCLDQARDRLPSHPALAEVDQALDMVRARRRAPLEAAAGACLEAGDLERAEELVRELSASFPESREARHLAARLAVARARARQRALEEEARAAEAAGDDETAALLLGQAAALAPPGEAATLSHQADLAGERARARREAQAVQSVLAAAETGALEEILVPYAVLDAQARAHARSRLRGPAWAWADELLAGGRDPAETARAVSALVAGSRALEEGEPRRAWDLLKPHQVALRRLAAGREVLAQALEADRARQARQAREALEQARQAWDAGDLDAVEAALGAVDQACLEDEERRRHAALQDGVRAARETHALSTAARSAESSGDWLAARALWDRLAARTQDAAGEEARLRARACRQQGMVAWAWQTETQPGIARLLADPRVRGPRAHPWLTPGGEMMVTCAAHGPWCVVQWVHVPPAGGALARATTFRAPFPVGEVLDHALVGDHVLVVGREAGLRLGARDGEVLDARPWTVLLPRGEQVREAVVVPGTSWAWLTVGTAGGAAHVHVVDLDRWVVARVLGDVRRTLAASPVLVGVLRGDDTLAFYDAGGTAWTGFRPVPPGPLLALSRTAVPGGLLVVCRGRGASPTVEATAWAEDGTPTGRVLLATAEAAWATAGRGGAEAQRVAVLLESEGGRGRRVVWLETPGGEPRVVGDEEVDPSAVLVTQAGDRGVAILEARRSPPGVKAWDQGVTPTTPRQPAADERWPTFDPWSPCGAPGDVMAQDVEGFLAVWRDLPGHDHGAWLRRHLEAHARDPGGLVRMLHAARLEPRGVDVAALAATAHAAQPDHAGLALLHACFLAQQGRWGETQRVLGPIHLPDLQPAQAQHALHVLGMALFHLGAPGDAAQLWTAAGGLAGTCPLACHVALAAPMASPPAPWEWGPAQPLVRQLVGAIRTADHALATGDVALARAALDRPATWWAAEVQGLARLASLELDDASASRTWLRRAALSAFLEAHRRPADRRDLPVPGAAWPRARLDGLAHRAMDWLAASPGEPAQDDTPGKPYGERMTPR